MAIRTENSNAKQIPLSLSLSPRRQARRRVCILLTVALVGFATPALASVRTLCATAGDAVSLDPDPCQDIPPDPTPPPPPEQVPCNRPSVWGFSFRKETAWAVPGEVYIVKAWSWGDATCSKDVPKIVAEIGVGPAVGQGGAKRSDRAESCGNCSGQFVDTRDNWYDDAYTHAAPRETVCFDATLSGKYTPGDPAFEVDGLRDCYTA